MYYAGCEGMCRLGSAGTSAEHRAQGSEILLDAGVQPISECPGTAAWQGRGAPQQGPRALGTAGRSTGSEGAVEQQAGFPKARSQATAGTFVFGLSTRVYQSAG
jgi:hypothetical protein